MPGQTAFGSALLDPGLPPPAGLNDPKGRPAGRRFDIYRNNVLASLSQALAVGFPVIAKLVGDEFFRAMAGHFVRAHPPEDPRLQLWGGKFPGFLSRFAPVQHLPYVPDVARLELGLRQSYHAADAAHLRLTDRESEAVLQFRPRLAPATLILASRHPVLSIWRKNSGHRDLSIDWRAETVLIARPVFDPGPRLMPAGGHTLARHLKGRLTLAAALTATQAAEPEADISALLRLFLSPGVLTLQQGDAPCAP